MSKIARWLLIAVAALFVIKQPVTAAHLLRSAADALLTAAQSLASIAGNL